MWTINIQEGTETELEVEGRHDPCIVPRVLPILEVVTAIGLMDLMLGGQKMNELEQYRNDIDAVDQELTRLFESRLNTVLKVGAYKKQHNLPTLDPSREEIVIKKNVSRLNNPQFEPQLTQFFQSMMEITKQTQMDLFQLEL